MKAAGQLANGYWSHKGNGQILTLDGIREGGVEVEDHLLETVGFVVFPVLVDDVDLDVPFAEGEALRSRRFVLSVACC